MNKLTLKWGTVKGWHLETEEAKSALQKWADGGVSMSAMTQNDTPEQKEALLNAIDYMDEIWLDWEGKSVSRDEAKEYVRSYGAHPTNSSAVASASSPSSTASSRIS